MSGWAAAAQVGGDFMSTRYANRMNREINETTLRFNALEAEKDRKFQDAQIVRQMAFQKNMANSAVQRRAQDLELAGFNRILAVGGQAPSPTGGAASGSKAAAGSMLPMKSELGGVISSAVQSYKTMQEMELIDQQVEKTRQEAELLKHKGDMAEPWAAFSQALIGVLERFSDSSAKDVRKAIPDKIEKLIDDHTSGQDIRKGPGIETTDHVKEMMKTEAYKELQKSKGRDENGYPPGYKGIRFRR